MRRYRRYHDIVFDLDSDLRQVDNLLNASMKEVSDAMNKLKQAGKIINSIKSSSSSRSTCYKALEEAYSKLQVGSAKITLANTAKDNIE